MYWALKSRGRMYCHSKFCIFLVLCFCRAEVNLLVKTGNLFRDLCFNFNLKT